MIAKGLVPVPFDQRIAFVTSRQQPDLHRDDRLVADALRHRGFDVSAAVWNDHSTCNACASGEEMSRVSDISVRPGQREILAAFSAAHLRKFPATRVLVTVTAQIGSGERTIAEYALEHAGAFDRMGGGG